MSARRFVRKLLHVLVLLAAGFAPQLPPMPPPPPQAIEMRLRDDDEPADRDDREP